MRDLPEKNWEGLVTPLYTFGEAGMQSVTVVCLHSDQLNISCVYIQAAQFSSIETSTVIPRALQSMWGYESYQVVIPPLLANYIIYIIIVVLLHLGESCFDCHDRVDSLDTI